MHRQVGRLDQRRKIEELKEVLSRAPSVRMWPISTSVNKPENDDSSIVEPIELDCGIICWVNCKTQCLKSRICGTSESSVEFPMLCLNVGHQGRPRGDLWSRD